ncbi:MAG: class I SAM-dependent methyltransferase, partial [Anaerolineales bacterium]
MTIEDWQIQADHFDNSEPFVPAEWKIRQYGFKYHYILKDYAIAEAIQGLKLAPGSMVLDAGCGTGVILDRLQSSYGTKSFGIDVSAKSLTRHRNSGQGGNRNSMADARQIPLADNVFDLAISLDVLEHMQSPEDAVREMMRVTRPGGWVVLYAVSRENRFTWIWMLTSFYEFLGINHWSWSRHSPDLLVDPNRLLSTLAGVSCEVRTAERFHSFFSLILV